MSRCYCRSFVCICVKQSGSSVLSYSHGVQYEGDSFLKGSDDGVMHFEESCIRILSIVQCFLFKKNVSETGSASVFR
jgi:hypothetical protein